ncbi:IS21 family transposase [Acidiphilium multivorum]|uniref:IS21 family transposase n=1 Tax=Acidiphilium multivorum TaxID=62140 RepID=UPI001B8CC10D|nr:IS21 family transposase [Acidiphilium multivorum]MBS3025623.1 IS21 family transposase [Acidiphilium multivorum]
MPARRELTMRQIRQMLRLAGDGISAREIGRMLGVARSTIQDNLKRAQEAGLAWPVPAELTDAAIEERLFARSGYKQGVRRRAEPAWDELVCELKRPGVNLQVLWEEYRDQHPDGYGYSRFCELFREFEARLSPVMRQDHRAGDKVFVDYSGKRIGIVDRASGEVRQAEIFVGVLGASSFTYAEASWTQTLPDWIGAHVRMFRAFGGVPRLIVPDNLKSGVNKPSFYDPEINLSYGRMASHYGVGVLPARPFRPRDKAKVESGVRFAQTYILGRLRRQTFFSLAEANQAIAGMVDRINDYVMRRIGVSRRHLFETIERPALAALPASDYEFAEWGLARVALDYHVEVCGFFYSVPHELIRQQVNTRATERGIEIFHHGKRIAVHQRRYGGRKHGTDIEHMPSAHRRYAEWTPERFRRWGASIGPHTEGLITAILASRPHPEQGFRTCLGILRLFKDLEPARAEAVADRAVAIGAFTYKSLASIVANKLDRSTAAAGEPQAVITHGNLRGSGYFH